MNIENTENTMVNPVNAPEMNVNPALNPEEVQEEYVEAPPGPHDIVIEEDFEINLDVKEVSQDIDINAPVAAQIQEEAPDVELGTEQSGNITF